MNSDSCSTRQSRDYIDISVHKNEQSLIYFPGDGDPLFMGDDMSRDDLLNYVKAPVARAVLAARLRAFADMLEPPPLDGLVATEATR